MHSSGEVARRASIIRHKDLEMALAMAEETESVPDRRRHRGPHPEDRNLFAPERLPDLCAAVRDLSWLLSHGYATASALKLVGDRYSLVARQRLAVARCACSDSDRTRRHTHQVSPKQVRGQTVLIDGYNVLTSIEAALSGGVLLLGRDGCIRDMASMHGSYRKVAETVPAIELAGRLLAEWQPAHCLWLLDQPVSNSGRLKILLQDIAASNRWSWQIDLVPDPDAVLKSRDEIVATADSGILNRAARWLNLAREVIEQLPQVEWLIRLES